MKSLTDNRGTFVVNAAIRLENNADFIIIKEWLDASLEDMKCQIIDTRGDNTLLAQGYADALRDITGPFNSPRRILERMRFSAAQMEAAEAAEKATRW